MTNANYFEIVLSQVQSMMKTNGIEMNDQSSLMKILRIAMECVELIRDENVKGSEKKNIVLKVLAFLVEKSSLDKDKKNLLRSIIGGGSLETTIDMIIDASKGQFELNRKTKRKLLACMGECLVTLSRKKQPVNDNDTLPASNVKIVKEAML